MEKHILYVLSLEPQITTQHLKMSGMYWATTALSLMSSGDRIDKEHVVNSVLECQKPSGGFGAHKQHDEHLLFTLSAIQILASLDSLHKINPKSVIACLLS